MEVGKNTKNVVVNSMSNVVKRIIAANNYIRGFFAYTTDMVKYINKKHDLNPVATAALGRLLSCSSMMGLMMKSPKDVLTVIVEGDGPMKGMCVTSDSNGMVKGYVYNKEFECFAKADGHFDVGGAIGNGVLKVIKDLGLKEPYNSSVPLITGEIGEDLTYYFAVSEQTGTSVGAGVLFDKNTIEVNQAGGFIVQVMPNTPEEVIIKLENNLKNIKSVTDYLRISSTTDELIGAVLEGFDYEVTNQYEVDLFCGCSKEKIVDRIKTLPKSQIIDIFKDTDNIEVCCEMCSTKYLINKDNIL